MEYVELFMHCVLGQASGGCFRSARLPEEDASDVQEGSGNRETTIQATVRWENMSRVESKEIPLISEAKVVKSGVVRVMELQEQGWTYVKP